ncbi:MAG: hypothetical protein U0V72_11065 [Cytophagales bacterium]
MFLEKIKNKETGILIYSITPPKINSDELKIKEIAQKHTERITDLPIDALIVYDVQDESHRTKEARPFPFLAALDPINFTVQYLNELKTDKIIYRPAGKYTSEELTLWNETMHSNGFYPVFVGVPSPDYVPKISLNEAYTLWHATSKSSSVIGAIAIPERHEILKDEDQRVWDKHQNGVDYFITQCIYNVEICKNMLLAILKKATLENTECPTIIFTLSTCGNLKTLDFLNWLGININASFYERLQNATNILDESVSICNEIASELIVFCQNNKIPFGFNIESVALKKEEIEASLQLVHQIKEKYALVSTV